MVDNTDVPTGHADGEENGREEREDKLGGPKRPRELPKSRESPEPGSPNGSCRPDQSQGAIDAPQKAAPIEPATKKSAGPRRKKQKGEPKAAQKPDVLFIAEIKPAIREDHPEWNKSEVHTEARKRWKQASEETKAEFKAKAEADKRRFEDEHQAWVKSQEEAAHKEAEEENEMTSLMKKTKEMAGEGVGLADTDVKRLTELMAKFEGKLKQTAEGKAAWEARLARFPAALKMYEDMKTAANEDGRKAKEKKRERKEKETKKKPAAWDPVTSSKPPMKPRTAYALYAAAEKKRLALEQDGGSAEEPTKEVTKKVQAAWRQLKETEAGQAERARWDAEAKDDQARYDREYAAWWEHRSEEEREKIAAEDAEKAAKAAKARAEAKAKAAANPKQVDLEGGPQGLTKEQVISFMQVFIPRHYLQGEILAWRELIEPMLRDEHPDLQWEHNPDRNVDKSILIKSMKGIWKQPDVMKPLPENLSELLLLDEEKARASALESYIRGLIAEIETSRKAGLVETNPEKRAEADEHTLTLEKFACETCLVWWCVVTRKPTLHSLGTDVKAMSFVAEMIQKRWFPRGAPGKSRVDWEGKEKAKQRRIEETNWRNINAKVNTGKLTSRIVDGKIVWVADDGGDGPREKTSWTDVDANREREAAEHKMIKGYMVKIENHLKQFIRSFKSVDQPRLERDVLSKAGVVFYPAGWAREQEHQPIEAEEISIL